MAKYNERWEEIPDKTPVALPIGYERPEPLQSMIARMMRAATVHAQKEGLETFEEADDFDCDDDEPKSQYEMQDMEEDLAYVGTQRPVSSPVQAGQASETNPPAAAATPAAPVQTPSGSTAAQ